MLTCDAFSGDFETTVRDTSQVIACADYCRTLREPEDDVFYYVLADLLNRIAVAQGISAAELENITSADAEDAAQQAMCSLQGASLPTLETRKTKSIILAQAINLLCGS